MSDWRSVPLRDVTTKIGSGSTPRGGKAVYRGEGVAFIRSQNVYDGRFSFDGLAYLSDEAAHALRGVTVHPGDVLINITGESVTRTALVPESALPARVSQHVAIVRPDPGHLDSRFLMSALLTPPLKAHLDGLSSAGATRRALTKGHLEATRISLPPFDEQRRIAAVLGAFDDLIERNRRLVKSLEQQARLAASQAHMLVPLSSFASVAAVGQVRPQGLVEHYSLPAFDNGATPECADGSLIQSNKLTIHEPSALVSRLNPKWERCWMVYPGESAVASTEFVPLLGLHAHVEEVWAVTSAPAFWEQMRERVTGTTGSHQRVDKGALLELMVPDVRALPGSVRDGVTELVRAASQVRGEIADVVRSRDELLPLLVSGRVRVEEVEGVI